MTDTSTADVFRNLGRTLGQIFNVCIYALLGWMYQIFFNVAGAQLFENETIKNFYGRVQLIIGVFMVFKVAIFILQGIVNPDKFMDPKEGIGNFITRVVIALALLTVLVPINIPNVESANSYEKYLNNNGLLFGTLYSLQDRILSNNTLGRLILGTTDDADDNTGEQDTSGMTEAEIQTQKLESSSRIFTSTILKGFLRINLLPEEVRKSDDENDQENWYCGDHIGQDEKDAINIYRQLDVAPEILLDDAIVKAKCDLNQSFGGAIGNFFNIGGDAKYLFAFNWWPIAMIVGIIFLVIMVGFTVDIAIRSIKLAILRLIAPIPVISYIEPKSSKDGGMFASWVKALTSTYLDLFLRLAIVYFVIFLIQDMIVNGVVINEATGSVGIFSIIFIWIGLFFFAKMAPKFIKDALGLKGSMSNVGLSGILGAAGAIRQGGSVMDAAWAASDAANAQVQSYNQGKPAPSVGMAFNAGRDLAAQMMTGDERMNHQKMSRGWWQLREMGITPQGADKVHKAAINAQAFSDRMSSDFVAGVGQYMDKNGQMHDYQYKDDQGNLHSVMDWATDENGNRVRVLNKDKASLALAQQRELAGKLASRDKKIDAEMHRTGQARGFRDSVRRPNDKSTHPLTQGITDVYLSRRKAQSYDPVEDKYGEKGEDNYMLRGGTHATGYDITEHY